MMSNSFRFCRPERYTGLFFGLAGVLLLGSCADSRIYDQDHDLAGRTWAVDSIQIFEFEVQDTAAGYSLYYKIRNAADYEFYNLYVKYTLEDSLHRTLRSELQELVLFDPKTGAPLGSGLGDIFSHEFPMMAAYTFPYRGRYFLSIQQYMRRDDLDGIHSVGLRIDRAGEE